MHPYLDHDGVLPIAHRGGALEFPENTMEAFAGAVALGYRYVETDVHLTRDGVVVVSHDPDLDRVSDGVGRIVDFDWPELARFSIAGAHPFIRLEALLDAWPDLRVNIDAKEDRVAEPLVRLLQARRALDRVCVGTFSQTRLARMRRLGGEDLCTAAGPLGVLRLALPGGLAFGGFVANCVQVPLTSGGVTLVDEAFIDRCHTHGLPVHVWVVDDAWTMRVLVREGVDGIMTDRPTLLRSVLEATNSWPSQPGLQRG